MRALSLIATLLLWPMLANGFDQRALPALNRSRLRGIISSRGPGFVAEITTAHPRSRVLARRLLSINGGAWIPEPIAAMPLPSLKLLLQSALTLLNIACWSLPLTRAHLQRHEGLLGLANAFAGGIFLMLSFAHLIPEAISALALAPDRPGYHALYYVLAGFLSMLWVEKVLFDADPHHIPDESGSATATGADNAAAASSRAGHQAFQVNAAVVLCLAMSIHSFFEAVALGMTSSRSSALLMAACIGLHQPAESLALVVAFLKSRLPRRTAVVALSLFSVVGLVGAGMGLVVTKMASPQIEAIMAAVTAGTFLFVGATEIVAEEFDGGSFRQKMARFGAYLAGMASMHKLVQITGRLEVVAAAG